MEKKLMKPGTWFAEFDENGNVTNAYFDKSYRELLGFESEEEYANAKESWTSAIHPEDEERVNAHLADCTSKHPEGKEYDIEYRMMTKWGYRWVHDYGHCIRREDGSMARCDGVVFDIQEGKDKVKLIKHEQLRREILDYLLDHEDDPIELLKKYAERIRVLIDCDQVIYRDLEETRIMVNSPAIEDTWSVPIEYCQQCEHFDAHHPMYAEGYTEMNNCQEGWQGIPVYKDCPIKSSLTRIVYCDGEIAGYLAIHYVQKYHEFTDIERDTLERFTRLLSLCLSGYQTRQENRELKLREELAKRTAISDYFINSYSAAYYCDLKTGELSVLKADTEFAKQVEERGLSYAEAVSGYVNNFVHPDDREKVGKCLDAEYMRSELEHSEDISFVFHDSSGEKPHIYRGIVISGEDSDHVGVGFKDITEDWQADQERHALSDGLSREYHTVWLVDGFGEHHLHLYRSTGQKTVQKAVQRGLDEPTYDGTMVKYVMDSVHEDDRERVLEASKFETVARETPDVGTYVVSYKRYCDDEGNVDYHQMCFAKAVAKDGTVNYILAFRDADKMLRDQIAQQQQLEDALSMAESANRAKTTFLNNMSHDIRTPMNAIIGYTGLAASHIDNKEQVQDYLGKIAQSSDHLLSLINDVLDMSRIESGKMNIEEKEENLSDIIHTLRDIVQADIHSKQLEFFVDAVDVNDEGIICDKLRLNQVLLNILSNAIKYTASGGTIIMRVRENTVRKNGYAAYEFRIKDNGMGMSQEFLEHIFDPFERVKTSTVSGIQGTGLGMAITKNIIDMMGGKIEIESKPGQGTEVVVNFDFKLQSAPKTPVVIPELTGVRGLVVDDDSNTCLSICHMLSDIGIRDEWCSSGKEAVIRAEEAYRRGDSYKVYIIDWLMPDMNGIETTRRIRKVIGEDIPIIVLTAYDWADIEDEARDAGVTAFVSKPLFPSDLHRVLNKCLNCEESAAESDDLKFDFTGKKVLLVEDNELNREIAVEILLEEGFEIDEAEDGDVAVEKMKAAKAGDYNLVLMDIQMPRMDGYEATRQIRALGTEISKIPILAMTANAFEEDRKAAIEAGMNEHIAKPIDIGALNVTLAEFL